MARVFKPVPEKRRQCPGCGEAISAKAVVCVRCGFNLQTGNSLRTQLGTPGAATETEEVRRITTWRLIRSGFQWPLWILGALPLLIYPFVLLANVMSLAAVPTGDEPIGLLFVVKMFLWGSTLYPLVYLSCLWVSVAYYRDDNRSFAFYFGLFPVIYVGFLGLLLTRWAMSGS